MQIAWQIFKIETAENGLVFFKNGIPAYLTKRFDVKKDKSKLSVEDFASLMKKRLTFTGNIINIVVYI